MSECSNMVVQPLLQWMTVGKGHKRPPPPDLPLAGEAINWLAALENLRSQLS